MFRRTRRAKAILVFACSWAAGGCLAGERLLVESIKLRCKGTEVRLYNGEVDRTLDIAEAGYIETYIVDGKEEYEVGIPGMFPMVFRRTATDYLGRDPSTNASGSLNRASGEFMTRTYSFYRGNKIEDKSTGVCEKAGAAKF